MRGLWQEFMLSFCPTPEQKLENAIKYKELSDRLAKDRECSTCKNRKHVRTYPGFVTGEECECMAGLECDTVMFSIKDCPKWEYADDEQS